MTGTVNVLLPVAAVAVRGIVCSGVRTVVTVRDPGDTLEELATVGRVSVGAFGVGADYCIGFVESRVLEIMILMAVVL